MSPLKQYIVFVCEVSSTIMFINNEDFAMRTKPGCCAQYHMCQISNFKQNDIDANGQVKGVRLVIRVRCHVWVGMSVSGL